MMTLKAWHQSLIYDRTRRNQGAIRALKILAPLWLVVFFAMGLVCWRRGDKAGAIGVLIVGVVLFSIMMLSTAVWCVLMLRQARRMPPPATVSDGWIAISWNDKLVANQEDVNRRLARMARILVPIWSLGVLGYAAFYWYDGDDAAASTAIVVGLVIPLILVLMIAAWCVLMLRQMRGIPPVTVTDSGIQIGRTLIPRAEIIRVESGERGPSRRRLSLHLRDGSTRRVGIPKSISVDAVEMMLQVRPTTFLSPSSCSSVASASALLADAGLGADDRPMANGG